MITPSMLNDPLVGVNQAFEVREASARRNSKGVISDLKNFIQVFVDIGPLGLYLREKKT